MALARAAPPLLLLLLLSVGAATGQLQRSADEDQQLRQLVREAVSDALRSQLGEYRCGGGNIRKRQAPGVSLQSVADELSLQLKDTKEDISSQLQDTRDTVQTKVAEMTEAMRQQGGQCTCVEQLRALQQDVQRQYDALLKSVVDIAEITIGTQQTVRQHLNNITATVAALGRNMTTMVRGAAAPPADPDMRLALLSDSFARYANRSRRQLAALTAGQERSAALLSMVANQSQAAARLPCAGPARDCADLRRQGFTASGVYAIRPDLGSARLVSVYCDMTTAGGGWTVLQRRADLSAHIDFFRGWAEYRRGFGNHSGEFWLGNELIHQLTWQRDITLRLDMADLEGNQRYAEYSGFSVSPETDQYRLTVGPYSGTAGDGLSRANGVGFTTRDVDNDQYTAGNCAELYKGGWWYDACHNANPNGLYLRGPHGSYADGVNWRFWRGYHYSLPSIEIKMRPSGFRLP
ncbi:fibrinogen-like protein 1 [Amphibalanus amphitrite]|uniref:fibrinogen-like protein 1 n=1 Tax=Amphibalanus amphitrite TaxID=1232801 RepID=UPI001C90857A|nr:fibrinogen-like protein 1 [Amphibalanus amphitrite]